MNNAENYRKEGLELEQQEKYEEAFLKYEEAAKMEDTPSMICITRMYLSGKFRAVNPPTWQNFLFKVVQYSPGVCVMKNGRTIRVLLIGL